MHNEAGALLAKIVAFARATPAAKVGISGYHDKTGNPDQNAELAKNRAKAVLLVLTAAGVPEERVVLMKPEVVEGGPDDKEARRVEVYVVQ